jgi:hypothetical protein
MSKSAMPPYLVRLTLALDELCSVRTPMDAVILLVAAKWCVEVRELKTAYFLRDDG